MTEIAETATPASAASQMALDALLHDVLPPQGRWSDDECLWLTDRCGRRVEFTDGRIKELPAPTCVTRCAAIR